MNGWHKEAFIAKSGQLSARWRHDDSRIVHIHSRIDPHLEAERIAAQLQPCGEQLLYYWFGVGLGYAAELFLQKLPDYSLLILDDPDPDARVFIEKHRPDSPLLSDHHVEWRCYHRSFAPSFYTSPELNSLGFAIHSGEKPVIKVRSHRRRQPGLQPVVLYLKSGYHLENELLAALRAEGVTVVEISYWQRKTFIERLLETIEATNPNFLLTINHLGFDEEGRLTRLLEKLQLPIASWFVDSPSYILQNHRGNQSNLVTTFLWEEAYAKRLEEWFPNPVWLPLAGDERRLREPATKTNSVGIFVGDSQFAASIKWRKRLPDLSQFDRWIADASLWLHQNRLPIWEWRNLPELTDEALSLELESAIVIEASRQYRWHMVQSLTEAVPFAVYGDQGWQYAPGGLQRFPAVNYFTELPEVYSNAAFVLNLTSYQMPTAVNQRVFDVPLCGGILLTDRQSDLARLFAPDAFYTFADREEAPALAKWLLHHPEQAEKKRLQQLQTILEKHTYRHRIRTILQVMSERHCFRISVLPYRTATTHEL